MEIIPKTFSPLRPPPRCSHSFLNPHSFPLDCSQHLKKNTFYANNDPPSTKYGIHVINGKRTSGPSFSLVPPPSLPIPKSPLWIYDADLPIVSEAHILRKLLRKSRWMQRTHVPPLRRNKLHTPRPPKAPSFLMGRSKVAATSTIPSDLENVNTNRKPSPSTASESVSVFGEEEGVKYNQLFVTSSAELIYLYLIKRVWSPIREAKINEEQRHEMQQLSNMGDVNKYQLWKAFHSQKIKTSKSISHQNISLDSLYHFL